MVRGRGVNGGGSGGRVVGTFVALPSCDSRLLGSVCPLALVFWLTHIPAHSPFPTCFQQARFQAMSDAIIGKIDEMGACEVSRLAALDAHTLMGVVLDS